MSVDQAVPYPPQQDELPAGPASMLPLSLRIPVQPHLYGGGTVPLTLHRGLTVLLGPNGTGKTQVLRAMKPELASALYHSSNKSGRSQLKARFLAAGRSAPFEQFRSTLYDPSGPNKEPAAVGYYSQTEHRHVFESLTGDMLTLRHRPDLLLKVEVRLQALFRRRLRLEWTQNGLVMTLLSLQSEYSANTEASGVLHLIGLLAALYDDQVGALLIDEPEISLHPQLQAFLLDEIRRVAGDPMLEPGKKIVVLSTHAQGMLPLRRIDDLPSLVFFSDVDTVPRQVPRNAGELQRRRLAALVTRLGASHRAAFFATTVLLVEGPSDEIIVGALAARFDRSLGGSGAEVVPVTGKSEIPETARLFRLMGKRIVVLADLDALVDDNTLVNAFAEEAGSSEAAIEAGHSTLVAMDGSLRTAFARAVSEWWAEIEPLASGHHYLQQSDVPLEKASRRAALAVLLSTEEAALLRLPNGVAWRVLRNRFGALLRALEAGGCFVLRRGTIEDFFHPDTPASTTGKPEAAADEAAAFPEASEADLRQRYADVLRAVERAAPAPPIDENVFLRVQLASLLAPVLQILKSQTGADEIALAAGVHHEARQLFALENAASECGGAPALRICITSPLFARPTFPAIIRRDQHLPTEVERLLP